MRHTNPKSYLLLLAAFLASMAATCTTVDEEALSPAPPWGECLDTLGDAEGSHYTKYRSRYYKTRAAWYEGLNEDERDGLETWYLWTGCDDGLYHHLAQETQGGIDFLQFAQTPRDQRFERLGAINNPDCRGRQEPDELGLLLDDCDDPNDVGIMGMRKFKNPAFDPEEWDYQAYLDGGAQIEPPWRIGIACGICHVAYNPLAPPEDPNEPEWENLLPAYGNQYILEGKLFAGRYPADAFELQVLKSQQPGTSDTSRNATDHINNPNVINSIQNLAYRPSEAETMQGTREQNPFLWQDTDADGRRQVHHILKDGADSVGVAGASLRVYVNIGMCWEYWLTRHDLGRGETPQQPFEIERMRNECEGWQKTEVRMANAEKYLQTQGPLYLRDVPGGAAYLTADQEVLRRGAQAFAHTCAECHSSKLEPQGFANETARADWYLSDDFRHGNFLSDDKRHSVLETQTNIGRAMGSNALGGHIWDQFSSDTYKALPSAGSLTDLYNPLTGAYDVDFELPAGGLGYYRTPTLLSIWASAPFLHNNSVGKYDSQSGRMDVGDPSLESRMEQFEVAIEKLLWSEKRDHWVKRTDRATVLRLLDSTVEIPIPEGYPINLLANFNPRALPEELDFKDVLAALRPDFRSLAHRAESRLEELRRTPPALQKEKVAEFVKERGLEKIRATLLELNQSPDFVEDRGHTFATELSDEDKRALIEFLKTL